MSWAVGVHGGAGDIDPERLSAADREARHVGLQTALRAAGALLVAGGRP